MIEEFAFWGFQGFIAILLFIIRSLLKESNNHIKESLEERRQETNELRRELHEMKALLPQSYVLRDDYIRTMADFNRKLDRLLEHSSGGRR